MSWKRTRFQRKLLSRSLMVVPPEEPTPPCGFCTRVRRLITRIITRSKSKATPSA